MPHAEDAENAEGRRDLGAKSEQVACPEFTMEVYETADQDLNVAVSFLAILLLFSAPPLCSLLPLRLVLAA